MTVLILFDRLDVDTTYFAYACAVCELQKMHTRQVHKKSRRLRSVQKCLTRSYDLNGTFLSLFGDLSLTLS